MKLLEVKIVNKKMCYILLSIIFQVFFLRYNKIIYYINNIIKYLIS